MENPSRHMDWRKLISYLQVASLWVLIAAIPFRMGPFPLWAMIAAGALFLLEYAVDRRWRAWRWERDKWLYVAMIAFYLFIPIWQIWSDTLTWRFSFVLGERLPLALCGIIGLLGFSGRVRLRHACYAFITGCVLTSLYIISGSGGLAFFAHGLKEQSELFTLARIRLVNSHMMYNLYLNVSLIFALYLLRQKDAGRRVRILVIAACLWMFYLLCITEGRIGLFTALLIGATFLLVYVYRRSVKWLAVLIAVYTAAGAALVVLNGRFGEENMKREPRWGIWQVCFEMIKEKPLTGYGVCDARELFIKKVMEGDGEQLKVYQERVRCVHNGNPQKVQPHNAFLETWSEFGIAGVATLLFIFLFPLTMQPREHRFYILLVVGCFLIQCMTDSFFSPLLYCLAIILLTSRSAISGGAAPRRPGAA